MSCSPFDLRDYVLNELADPDGRLVETHLKTCDACREELDRLRTTEAALMSVPDEEIPQRIGFVSDRVFEPSRLRRWWQALWGSAARLGFASAAMLSIAIMVSALTRPAPAPPSSPARQDLAGIEARVNQRIEAAVRQAVEETAARQENKTAQLLAAAEMRHNLDLKSVQMAVEENLKVIEKRQHEILYMANSELSPGAAR
jgi:anti-sigma factor RsiW